MYMLVSTLSPFEALKNYYYIIFSPAYSYVYSAYMYMHVCYCIFITYNLFCF